jgi:phosphohistidine swiveling domain-containing protein
MAGCAPLAEAADATRYGGKAAGLARLIAAGLPVPDGFSVAPEATAAEIQAALGELGDGPVAVRSSAAGEDGAYTSFAGQHLTELGVEGADAVLEAIERCRSSLAGSEDYRATRGVGAGEMAVVVQRMVEASAAGVAFTADPVSGDRDVVLVDAVRGLGEDLVAGRKHPDHWAIARDGTIRECRPVGETPVLADDDALGVAALAVRAETNGDAVDVEWALDGRGELWLLQARPVTAAGAPPDFEALLRPGEVPGPDDRWTRAIGDEFWADATSPFYFSAMGRGVDERVTKDLARLRGLPVEDDRPTLRLYGGRVYWSEESAFEIVSLAPKSMRTERVVSRLSPPMRERAEQEPFVLRKRLRADFNQWRRAPEGRIGVAYELLDEFSSGSQAWAEHFESAPSATREDLRARWAEIEEQGRWSSDLVRWGMSVHPTALLLLLATWCEKWLEDPGLAGILLSGLPTRTLDVNRDLWLLGRHADGPDFDAALDEFLARHGHRSGTREPAEPRWRDEPEVVAALARSTRGSPDPEDLLRQAGERREAAERDALARLGFVRRRVFKRVLDLARTYTRFREDQRYDADRFFAAMRTYALAAGRLAVEQGRLAAPEDAFMLTPEEIDALLDGRERPHAGGWRGLVAGRRAVYERAKHVLPPTFLVGDEVVAEDDERPAEGEALSGTAVSTGVVEAVARVVPNLEAAARLGAGEVLVTSNTDPGWTGLFMRAAGLVLETGGLLAHGAIVAREYGLPAVTAVPDATVRIPDGARVRVDGQAGTVTLLD